jgi:hypothetical protein
MMIKSKGPVWHEKQKQKGEIPKGLTGIDKEATWSKSRADGLSLKVMAVLVSSRIKNASWVVSLGCLILAMKLKRCIKKLAITKAV